MRAKITLLTAAAGLLLTLGAGTAQADHRECQKKINKAENRLRDAIRNHGPYSNRARERRANLNRVLAQCGGSSWNRGRDDNWWGWGQDRDRDGRWNRGRTDNVWNRGRQRGRDHGWRDNRGRNNGWFWSSDGRRHRHSRDGAWCNQRH